MMDRRFLHASRSSLSNDSRRIFFRLFSLLPGSVKFPCLGQQLIECSLDSNLKSGVTLAEVFSEFSLVLDRHMILGREASFSPESVKNRGF